MRRILSMAVVVALFVVAVVTSPAAAQERDVVRDAASDEPVTDVAVDVAPPEEPATDAAADSAVTDEPPTDVDRPVDRCAETDRVTDKCHVIDRPDDVDYRALIIRLIHAHEWQKLLRLLHALGVI